MYPFLAGPTHFKARSSRLFHLLDGPSSAFEPTAPNDGD